MLEALDPVDESSISTPKPASTQDAIDASSVVHEEDVSSLSESIVDRKAQKVADLKGGQNAWVVLGILLSLFGLFSVFANLNHDRQPEWPWQQKKQKEQAGRSKRESAQCLAQYQKAKSGTLKDTTLTRGEYIATMEKHRQDYERCIKGWW